MEFSQHAIPLSGICAVVEFPRHHSSVRIFSIRPPKAVPQNIQIIPGDCCDVIDIQAGALELCKFPGHVAIY